MKFAELKDKDIADLKKILFDLQEDLREARFDLSFGKMKNVAKIKMLKKDIAAVMTLINNLNKKK